ERTNYPLTLNVDDFGDGFTLNAQVQSPIDPQRICAYMRAALEQLTGLLERTPAIPVNSMDVLPEPERHQLLVEWNATEVGYPLDECLHELFERQAFMTPDAVAVVSEESQLTYRELNARANRLGHYLRKLGVKPDTKVAICAERSPEMVVGLLAILKAGGGYVP